MFENAKEKLDKSLIVITLSILLFGIFDCINMYKIPSIFSTIFTNLELEPTTTSWLMTSYSIAALILAIPTGWLSRKFGYFKILIIGICLSVLGSIIEAITFSIPQWNISILIFGRILEGTCYIFSSVCIPILIEKIVHKNHIGTIMGIWAIRVPIACFIGESLTPVLVETLNVSSSWVIYVVLVVISSTFTIIILKKNYTNCQKKNQRKTETKGSIKSKDQFLHFLLFLISFMFIAIIQTGILNYVPTILQIRFDMNGALSGFLTSLTMIVSIPSSLVFGYLCDKLKTYKYIYIFGCLLMGPGAFLMFNYSGVLFVLGQILLGIGLGAPAISANAVFEILEPKYHSIGIGIGMAAFSLGQVLGSSLTQIILDNNFDNVLTCAIVLLVIGLIGTIIACFSKTRQNTNC